MDIKRLALVQSLAVAAHGLSSWCETLEYYTENPTAIPNRAATTFETREEFIEHIGNMIGYYQDLFNKAYNAIPEWVSK